MASRRWLLALLAAALLRSLVVGTLVPPYQSSDEQWHLDVARVVSSGHLPVYLETLDDPAIDDAVRRAAAERHLTAYGIVRANRFDIEAIQPPLGYLVPAVGYRIADGPTGGLFAFRLYNALAGAVVVVLAVVLAARCFPTRRWAGPMAGVVAVAAPPLALVASTANNDATLAVLAVAAIGLGAVLAREGGPLTRWIALGALVGVSGVAKTSGLVLLAPAVLAGVIAPAAHAWVRLRRVTAVVATSVIAYLPWAVHNWTTYGDALDPRRASSADLSKLRGPFWVSLWQGAVGVLRWTDLYLPTVVYVAAIAVAGAAVVRVVRWLMADAAAADRRAASVITCAFGAAVAGVVWYSFRVDYQPQGRYLAPELVALGGLAGAAVGRRGFVAGVVAFGGLLATAVATLVHAFGLPV